MVMPKAAIKRLRFSGKFCSGERYPWYFTEEKCLRSTFGNQWLI